MKSSLDILIVEDHLGFAEGMKLLLAQNPRIKNTYIVGDFQETLNFLRNQFVHIIILDLDFNTKDYDGFIIAKKVRQQYPDIKIMILTQHARKEHHQRLFEECGVNAYLDKKLGIGETYKAIDQVMSDETYIDHSIKEMLEIEGWMTISNREREVINYLKDGLTQKEIASKMFIVPKTVEVHIRNLFDKFDVKNSVELVAKYVKYRSANRDNAEDSTPPFKNI